jgi:hypothetical protein
MSLFLALVLAVRSEGDAEPASDLHSFTELFKRQRALEARLEEIRRDNPGLQQADLNSEVEAIQKEINEVIEERKKITSDGGFGPLLARAKKHFEAMQAPFRKEASEPVFRRQTAERRRKIDETINWLSVIACGLIALILVLSAKFISLARGTSKKRHNVPAAPA